MVKWKHAYLLHAYIISLISNFTNFIASHYCYENCHKIACRFRNIYKYIWKSSQCTKLNIIGLYATGNEILSPHNHTCFWLTVFCYYHADSLLCDNDAPAFLPRGTLPRLPLASTFPGEDVFLLQSVMEPWRSASAQQAAISVPYAAGAAKKKREFCCRVVGLMWIVSLLLAPIILLTEQDSQLLYDVQGEGFLRS